MRIAEALEKFLVQLQADGRSPHTIGQYQRHIRLLAQWARDAGPRCQRIEKLDHEAVARFLASDIATLRAGGGQKLATSANCLRSSIKTFLGHCHRAGYISHDAGGLIRRARCSPPPPRSLSEKDQRRLLSVLDKARGQEAERDCMLFGLMLRTGIRVGSAVALDVDDVDLDKSEIQLRRTKGDRPDVVFLGAEVQRHLRRYLAHCEAGPLFPGRAGVRITGRHVHRRFRQWLRKAGITRPASPHSLRHSFAASLYKRSGDILLVKEALRHRSIASTLIYAHASDERLRKALA